MLPRPLLGLYFLARAGEFRITQPAPSRPGPVKVLGPHPVRVLVAGAGLAYGYGVAEVDAALAGTVARDLAERTGRGVVVDTRAVPVLPMRNAIDLVGMNGAHTYDAVIFGACYLEARSAPGLGLRRHVPALIEHLRATGSQRLEIVLPGFPRPAGTSGIDLATDAAVVGVNRVLEDLAAEQAGVHYVEPAPFGTMRSRRPFGPDLYAGTARRIVDVLAPRFRPAHH